MNQFNQQKLTSKDLLQFYFSFCYFYLLNRLTSAQIFKKKKRKVQSTPKRKPITKFSKLRKKKEDQKPIKRKQQVALIAINIKKYCEKQKRNVGASECRSRIEK